MTSQCAQGHDNTPGSAFCSTCGTPLAPTSALPTEAPPRPAPTAPDVKAAALAQDPQAEAATHASPPAPAATAAPAGSTTGSQNGTHAAHTTDQPSSKRNVLIAAGVGALLLILVVGGILFSVLGGDGDGSTAAAKSGKTLRGIAVLFDTDGSVEGSWDDCEGTNGYDDFTAGMSLKITGTNDEIVGSGDVVNVTEDNIDDVAQAELDGDNTLGMDATTHDEAVDELRGMLETGESISCILYFEAAIEPSDFYSVELGSRGALNFSKADLEKSGYVIGYSLGDL